MSNYVLNPNLPSGKVLKIICGINDKEILDFFIEKSIDVLRIEENSCIDSSVSLHADMAALHLGGNMIIIDKSQTQLKSELEQLGFVVYEISAAIKGKYPDDVRLNFTLVGDCAVGNFKHADPVLLKQINNKKRIFVRQGYCKCSTLIVNEKAIITDDEGIFSKMRENGFDALLISKGDIFLQGHDYGFIGGASGKISKDTVVFFGDITFHRDFEKINAFLSKYGCRYVCTDSRQLRDIGGFISLTEA